MGTDPFIVPVMETVAHLAEDSDEDFSGLPTLEDKGHEKKVSKSDDEEVGEKAPEKDTNKSENNLAVLDDDGWEDVLGSGRLKKRIVKKGEEGIKPGKGTRVKVKVEDGRLQGHISEGRRSFFPYFKVSEGNT